jgi:hypothetical protein
MLMLRMSTLNVVLQMHLAIGFCMFIFFPCLVVALSLRTKIIMLVTCVVNSYEFVALIMF